MGAIPGTSGRRCGRLPLREPPRVHHGDHGPREGRRYGGPHQHESHGSAAPPPDLDIGRTPPCCVDRAPRELGVGARALLGRRAPSRVVVAVGRCESRCARRRLFVCGGRLLSECVARLARVPQRRAPAVAHVLHLHVRDDRQVQGGEVQPPAVHRCGANVVVPVRADGGGPLLHHAAPLPRKRDGCRHVPGDLHGRDGRHSHQVLREQLSRRRPQVRVHGDHLHWGAVAVPFRAAAARGRRRQPSPRNCRQRTARRHLAADLRALRHQARRGALRGDRDARRSRAELDEPRGQLRLCAAALPLRTRGRPRCCVRCLHRHAHAQ
eukprot:Opistho-1_new@94069